MKKYFYEKNNLVDWEQNITFHQLLLKSKEELEIWLDDLRDYIVTTWNERNSTRSGKTEKDIIAQFNKLQRYDVSKFLHRDELDKTDTIIKNFNKFATVIDQFFPTMLKTKMALQTGTHSESIYDYFVDPDKRDSFHVTMRRTIRRDAFFAHGKTIRKNDNEVPYPTNDGETWIRNFIAEKHLHPDNDFWIIELFAQKESLKTMKKIIYCYLLNKYFGCIKKVCLNKTISAI